MRELLGLITAADPALRNQSLDELCAGLSAEQMLEQCGKLDAFRRESDNLYERVRALFFLYAIHRFHLPRRLFQTRGKGRSNHRPSLIPFKGYEHLLHRR